jgi:hypothetical protein
MRFFVAKGAPQNDGLGAVAVEARDGGDVDVGGYLVLLQLAW